LSITHLVVSVFRVRMHLGEFLLKLQLERLQLPAALHIHFVVHPQLKQES